jgi:hypothetical protein
MAEFISVPKATLIQLAAAGPLPAGNIYFCADTNECFVSCTGAPGVTGNLFPLSSVVLSGTIQAPTGAQGEPGEPGATGAQGPARAPASLAQSIAMAIALS